MRSSSSLSIRHAHIQPQKRSRTRGRRSGGCCGVVVPDVLVSAEPVHAGVEAALCTFRRVWTRCQTGFDAGLSRAMPGESLRHEATLRVGVEREVSGQGDEVAQCLPILNQARKLPPGTSAGTITLWRWRSSAPSAPRIPTNRWAWDHCSEAGGSCLKCNGRVWWRPASW